MYLSVVADFWLRRSKSDVEESVGVDEGHITSDHLVEPPFPFAGMPHHQVAVDLLDVLHRRAREDGDDLGPVQSGRPERGPELDYLGQVAVRAVDVVELVSASSSTRKYRPACPPNDT